jgi:eukaryotic-like serine/threonine-protein kinase
MVVPAVIKDLKAGDPVTVGPYKLLGRLGAGGMGMVYLAKSPGGRLVAIKLIRPELAEDRGFRTRFASEIAAARGVSGIFTAAVVDADAEAEEPWMATVYVPGPSLTDAVEDNGPLPVKSVLALAAGLAEALEAIHRAGLVHRDMKPSNVLLAADGPRVIDFGISRALERSMMTTTGMVLGSPGFMSPEQALGEQVGQPTDVFSLGTVLAYAATGAGPFGSGPTPALLYRVVREEPDLTQVPDRLRPLITSCLAKDPALRPTPAGLLADLSDDVDGLTGEEWLPQSIAAGMGQYRPALSTPLPPALRPPDSGSATPVPGPGQQSGPGAAPVPATPWPATALSATPGAAASRPSTELAATQPPGPERGGRPAAGAGAAVAAGAAAAAAAAIAATSAEYNLADTSLAPGPGGYGGPGRAAGTGAGTVPPLPPGPTGPTGPGGPGGPGGLSAGPARRRPKRWPLALAAAAVVIVAAVASVFLLGSHGTPGNQPGPGASLDGTLTSSPSATPSKATAKPSATRRPASGGSTAPAYTHSATPTATWTPTPTAKPTSSPTRTPTATSSPTWTPTATASASPTTAPTTSPTTTAPTATAAATP